MTEEKKVQQIVEKYNKSIWDLTENGTIKEVKTVFKFFADEANRKQRELIGLDKK